MKICLMTIGQTHKKWAKEAEKEFEDRIAHYISFERVDIPDIKTSKKLSEDSQKQQEGKLILEKLQSSDFIILLDERGKRCNSKEFSRDIQDFMNRGLKRVVFIVGGPYGFSDEVYTRAGKNMLSLSAMTFPHDLVRVVFLEQLYRAFTILRNEPYHHE